MGESGAAACKDGDGLHRGGLRWVVRLWEEKIMGVMGMACTGKREVGRKDEGDGLWALCAGTVRDR